MSDLTTYLREAAGKPMVWGSHDCCTFPGAWAEMLTGVDPVSAWRGYTTEAEAEAFIAEAGGIAALWNEGLEGIACAIDPTELEEGDIGILRVIAEHEGQAVMKENGAIFTGKRWAFVGPLGLYVASVEPENVVKAWRVG